MRGVQAAQSLGEILFNTLGTHMKVDSASRPAGPRTTFALRGAHARYYILWITDLGSNQSVRVNEVTARG